MIKTGFIFTVLSVIICFTILSQYLSAGTEKVIKSSINNSEKKTSLNVKKVGSYRDEEKPVNILKNIKLICKEQEKKSITENNIFNFAAEKEIVMFNSNCVIKYSKGNYSFADNIKEYKKSENYEKISEDLLKKIGEIFTIDFYCDGTTGIIDRDKNLFLIERIYYDGIVQAEIEDMAERIRYVADTSLSGIKSEDNIILAVKSNGGFLSIDKKSKKIAHNYILPNINTITGVIEEREKVYISSTDGSFYSIDKKSGEINILDELDENIEYTNMVRDKEFIYLGKIKKDINGRYVNNELLIFNINSEKIVKIKMDELFGLRELKKFGNKIFVIGNRVNSYEGGVRDNFGGLGVVKNNCVKIFDNLKESMVSVEAKLENRIVFKSYQEDNEGTEVTKNYFEYNLENGKIKKIEYKNKEREENSSDSEIKLSKKEIEILNGIKCNRVIYEVEKIYKY